MFGRAAWVSTVALIAVSACSGGANQSTPADSGGYAPQASTVAQPQDTRSQVTQATQSQATQTGAPSAALPHGTGYTVTVFARGTSTLTNPDAVVSTGGWTYVAYQNKTSATGGGGDSTIVKYGSDGTIHHTWNLAGRIDGMRFNPYDGLMWATVNEDGNSSLYTIDLVSFGVHHYTFSAATHGGGYDDLAFSNGKAFIAASNPTLNSAGVNTHPAVVAVTLKGRVAEVLPDLMGNALARDVTTGKSVLLNLTDPDSMTVAPNGDVVLVSQADQEIVRLHNPGVEGQTVTRLLSTAQLDDTQFALESDGLLYVVDQTANVTYVVRGAIKPGAIYTEANTFVGIVNPVTGAIQDVLTGFQKPSGLLFVGDRD